MTDDWKQYVDYAIVMACIGLPFAIVLYLEWREIRRSGREDGNGR